MNLYVYLKMPKPDAAIYQSPDRRAILTVLAGIENTGLPIAAMKQLRSGFLADLADHQDDAASILARWKTIVQKKTVPYAGLKSLRDFWLFAGLWIFLQAGLLARPAVALGEWATLSVGLLLETVAVYAILRAVVWILEVDLPGWKRWLALIALFAAYLVSMYVGNQLDFGLRMPLYLILTSSAMLAWSGWIHLKYVYERETVPLWKEDGK